MTDAGLDAALLGAHAAGDIGGLAMLYGRAADQSDAAGQSDRACFFLTQAYIFALEAGLPVAADYNRRLAGRGRDVLHPELAQHLKVTA
jgi:hypothetical protein